MAVQTHPCLAEEHRAAILAPDEDREHDPQRREHDDERRGQDDIPQAFDEEPRTVEVGDLDLDQGDTVDRAQMEARAGDVEHGGNHDESARRSQDPADPTDVGRVQTG